MSASHDDALGTVIAQRYRLDELLGRGAMGAVYRAHDLRSDSPVAVKVMHPGLSSDPSIIERFTREAEAAAQLDHPNCVQVLAAGTTTEGLRFLVMPLFDGTELRREMNGGMALRRTVDLVLQVLAGLAHAHSRGFIHRDVKPENVLLVRDAAGNEVAKLVDFGLVKAISVPPGARALTAVGRVFGTPWYMAPEQAAGQHVDARADLYAVGVMMFEMLTGAPPFDGDSLAAVLTKHMFAELPPLPTWVPAPIGAVLHALLEKRAEDRPADAVTAAAMLRHAMVRVSSQPTVVPELTIGDAEVDLSRPPSMLRSAQREGRIFGVLAAVAATVALALGLSHVLGSDDAAPVAAIEQVVAATPSVPAPTTSTTTSTSTSTSTTPVLAAATPAAPAPPATVHALSPTPTRATGAHPSPTVHKPAAKPPRALPKPPSDSSGPRKIAPSRPPRTSGKLPGVGPSATLSREGGKLHLRPGAG